MKRDIEFFVQRQLCYISNDTLEANLEAMLL